MTTYEGSCHCGAVSFTFDGEIEGGMDCNCSYCRRQGRLLTFGPAEKLTVTAEDGALRAYSFNRKVIDHFFCTRCGVSTHALGDTAKGRMAAINIRCIPAINLEALPITKVDGARL